MKIGVVRGPFFGPWEAQIFEHLARRHDVTVYTTSMIDLPSGDGALKIEKLASPDLLFARLPAAAGGVFTKVSDRMFGRNHYIYGLEDRIRDNDVVHGLELFHTFDRQIIEAKKKHGFAAVSTVFENVPHAFEKHPARIRVKEQSRLNVDLFIAVSESIRATLMTEGVSGEKIAVVPPGVDVERFRPAKKSGKLLDDLGISPDDFVALFVGRLVWEKGVYEFLYAAKRLLQHTACREKMKFVVAGAGAEEREMRSCVERFGLSPNVRFAGRLSYDRLPELHNIADAFVLPSIPTRYWREQFGFVLAEAMACGKPVVSTLTGSIPEVVGEGGILVPPADHAAIADALERLFRNETLRRDLADKARRIAVDRLNAATVAATLESLYASLLAGR